MIMKTGKRSLFLGMAFGAAAVSAPILMGTAQAQAGASAGGASGGASATGGAMAGSSMSGGSMSGGTMMSSAPMMVSGRVNNYWTDASGYVTAVDVQTANGPAVIRFAPGMATRTMQMYPVGSTADFWVTGSMENGTQQWNMVGMGQKQPSTWYSAMPVSGSDLLASAPYVSGSPEIMSVSGRLKKVVVDKMGNVVALGIESDWLGKGAVRRTLGGRSAPGQATWQSEEGGMPMMALVRVPQEFMSAPNPGESMRRRTPLMLNDEIEATGFVEAPLYGTTSPFGTRFAANAISVNGRSVGQMGFPTFRQQERTLIGANFNIPFITGGSSDVLPIVPMGYEVYSPQMGANMGQGNAMMSK